MFKGKLIKLRSYKESDTETVLKLIEEEGIRSNLSPTAIFPYSYASEKSFIDMSMKMPEGHTYNFAIESLESGEYIGGCGINKYLNRERIAEIGIFIANEHQGKGYGKDSLITLCNFIFDEINARKIMLGYFSFNSKAGNLYKKIGFKEEGIHREEIFRHGKYYDRIYMGLFKSEFIKD